MTYVAAARLDFFQAFDAENVSPHMADIDACDLVSSAQGLALRPQGNFLGRWISFGVSFDSLENIKAIVEIAKNTLHLIKTASDNTPEERILSTCRAASRTCLVLERKHRNQGLNQDLYELGKSFLLHESSKLNQHPIVVACQNETLHMALDLLKAEPQSIHVALGHYTPLLKVAFAQKEYGLCRQFIQLGADPKVAFGFNVQEYATLLLIDAIREGQEKVAIRLVEVGANVHVPRDGKFPLHFAASQGFCRLAEEMIKRGASVLQPDHDSNTPLHDACRAYQADMALLLVQNQADVAKINREIHNPNKNISGLAAFCLPEALGDRERAADFYCRVIASYNPSRELLVEKGIYGFLQECAETPQKLIHGLSGPNPFELALLFQDANLAKKVAQSMPLKRFYEYVKKLQAKYPTCNLDVVEFCFLTLANPHLERPIAHLETRQPPRDIALEELVGLIDGALRVNGRELSVKDQTRHIQALIGRIQSRSEMPALLKDERDTFYKLLEERCLKNILITLQDTHADHIRKKTVLRELIELELGEHCAGRYFGVITKLFRTNCTAADRTFEDEIAILLALHREIILEQCVDPMKGNNQNDYNHLLAHLGQKLGIPGYDATTYYLDLCGQADLEAAEQQFFRLYTISSIIKDCIKPALENSVELREKFSEWMLRKMPNDWADGLRQNLIVEQDKQLTTPAHIRDFLRRNGVPIDDNSTDYVQAFESARERAYLEQEVFENGKIRPQALCRMLAWLDTPVVSSDKLGHETSPSTFACDWLLDIFDMVRK